MTETCIDESRLELEPIVFDQRLRRKPDELISVNKEQEGKPESKRINNGWLGKPDKKHYWYNIGSETIDADPEHCQFM
ncbi:hypothetical protein [Desulfoferrobacter suflitae]|uniref:hypothetical protein n=1 Tax=Desulfoferrobacter suflitae TaxID=2865782 RepID=UPI00216468E5|nr:hypothetical protein [Desulfoferrobacter suflitae]MCK8603438.1 hypothetical protein [Desulfoferrobacter suflitae]